MKYFVRYDSKDEYGAQLNPIFLRYDSYDEMREYIQNHADDIAEIKYPHKEEGKEDWIQPITFPNRRDIDYIHLIKCGDGIVFSDGTYTGGKKHCSKSLQEWFQKQTQEYNFIED